MRLAIVRRRYDPFGGAEKFIARALSTLNSSGIAVTMIAERWPLGDGYEIVAVPRRGITRAGKLRNFQTAARTAVERGNYNIVQSHERLLAADLYRAGDGVHAAWLDRQARERPIGRLRRLLKIGSADRLVLDTERRMVRETSMTFVANSRLVARELEGWLGVPASRLTVIENGIDLNRFPLVSVGERARAREAFGIAVETPVCAFVGSGYERKGAFALARALALPACQRISALIAGRDRGEEQLRRLVKQFGMSDRIQCLGPSRGVASILAAADLFVLPSLYDPMPNAAIEAIARGIPVVTTADTGIAEPLVGAGAGYVATRNPDDLAAAINAALANRDTLAAGARTLRTRFDISRATSNWIDLYRRLAPE